MKLHNPFKSSEFLPGFFALFSCVMIIILGAVIYPPILFAVILIPIVYTIRYILKGDEN